MCWKRNDEAGAAPDLFVARSDCSSRFMPISSSTLVPKILASGSRFSL